MKFSEFKNFSNIMTDKYGDKFDDALVVFTNNNISYNINTASMINAGNQLYLVMEYLSQEEKQQVTIDVQTNMIERGIDYNCDDDAGYIIADL